MAKLKNNAPEVECPHIMPTGG